MTSRSDLPRPTTARRIPARKSAADRALDIRAAARRVALRDGLAAVTLRGVAGEAAVTSALVAHYEPSMQALVALTFDGIAGDEILEVSRLLADGSSDGSEGDTDSGDSLGRLARLVTTLLDSRRGAVSALWADAWSLGRRNLPLAAATRIRMSDWHALARDIVASGLATGVFRDADADETAALLFALVDSTTAYALVDYGSQDAARTLMRNALERALGLSPEASIRLR